MTGSGSPSGAGPVHRGVTTFRVRQSSLRFWYFPGPIIVYDRFCGAQLPQVWAERTPAQGCAGSGARKRSAPTGGAA